MENESLKVMEDYILNDHNKEEFPPAHTAEHLLNQVMCRLFGCERSYNAHVERKKSKMSFHLDHKPTRQEEREIERRMQELITEITELSTKIQAEEARNKKAMETAFKNEKERLKGQRSAVKAASIYAKTMQTTSPGAYTGIIDTKNN